MPTIEPTDGTVTSDAAPTVEPVETDATAEPTEAAEVSEPGVIPPCTPVDGGTVDPCAPDVGQLSGHTDHRSQVFAANPTTLREYLEGGSSNSASHIVVRATYLPKTVRCVIKDEYRSAGYVGLGVWDRNDIQCFIDVRANEYMLGSGPDVLTVTFGTYLPMTDVALGLEDTRRNLETAYANGGYGADIVQVVKGGLPGREIILFLGPASNYLIEAWEIFREWDVQRKEGEVRAIHPHRPYWDHYGTDEQKAKTELTLSDFAIAVTTANAARKTANGGRVRPEADAPMIIASANASDLHQHHVDTGNTAHADGPPETSLPPPCGKAVPNQVQNPGLMLDCFALLAAKDALQGTGMLNWSVDVPMAEWDGVRIEERRVVALDLEGRGLTGCVPPSLRQRAVKGLDELGLPDCAG